MSNFQWSRFIANYSSDIGNSAPKRISAFRSVALHPALDDPQPRTHASLEPRFQFRQLVGDRLTLEQIRDVRHRRARDVLGRRVLVIHARREVEVRLAEEVLHERGTKQRALA